MHHTVARPKTVALLVATLLGSALTLSALPARAQTSASATDAAGEEANPLVQKLVEQGLYWQSRGEWSKARTAWEKVLLSEPAHPEALRGLFFDALQTGDRAAATALVETMRERRPGHRFLLPMEAALHEANGGRSALEQARELVREGRLEAALAQYRISFGDIEPNGELALEYYTTLGGAQGEWESAADGLARLLERAPGNARYALAYAKHLTYDARRRRDGIARLEALASERAVAAEALAARRKALLWLERTHADLPLYDAYLADAPEDDEIRALTEETRRSRTPVQRRLAAGAFAALEAGSLDDAAKNFRQLLRSRPRDADALAGLGIVELKQRDYANAVEHLEAALAAAPRERRDWREALDTARYWSAIETASDAVRAGDTTLANVHIDIALGIDATEQIGMLLKAETLHQRGETVDAERYYRAVLAENPDNVIAMRGLGRLFNDLGRYDEAERLARRSQEIDADGDESLAADILAESLVARSRDFFDKGDVDQAQYALEEALSTRADSPWVRLELAQLLLSRGALERARELMAELLQSRPEASDVLHANAEFAHDDGRYRDGLALLERIPADARTPAMIALQNRLWVRVQVRRAIALARTDRFGAARDTLEEAERVADGKSEMIGPLAEAWVELGDDARALGLVRAVLRRDPAVDLQLRYAGLLLRTERDDELDRVLSDLSARRDLNHLQRGQVAHIDISFALRRADRLLRDGDFAAAYVHIEPYLAENGGTPDVRMMLGRLYDASEDREEALAHYLAILRDEPRHLDARRAATGVLIDFGDVDRAEALVAEGLGYHPDAPRMHLLAGRLAASRGQSSRALSSFERSLALLERWASDLDAAEADDPNLLRTSLGGTSAAANPFGAGSPLAADGTSGALRLDDVVGLREEVLTEIGRTRAQRSARVRVGGPFRSRSGEAGFGKITSFGVPVQAEIGVGDTGRLGLEARASTFDAGTLQRAAAGSRAYGALALDTSAPDDRTLELGEDGFSGTLHYDSRHFGLRIGTTPLGIPVSNVVGGLYVTNAAERLRFTARAERDVLEDSLLSYAGQLDPFLGVVWGGVTRTGASLELKLDNGANGLHARVGSAQLEGENVASNSMVELGAGVFWRLVNRRERQVTIGFDIDSLAYERNLGRHTFGHGGYFSPQSYVNLSMPLTWSGTKGNLDFALRGKVGFESFEEEESPYYPNDAALQSQLEALAGDDEAIATTHAGGRQSGLAFGIGGDLTYRLSPRLSLGSSLAVQNAGDFNESRIGVYTTYYFSPQYRDAPLDPFGVGL